MLTYVKKKKPLTTRCGNCIIFPAISALGNLQWFFKSAQRGLTRARRHRAKLIRWPTEDTPRPTPGYFVPLHKLQINKSFISREPQPPLVSPPSTL